MYVCTPFHMFSLLTIQKGLYGALAELARRPEYIAPLREEIDAIFAKMGPTVPACDAMVLMDSFLKECQRLHPPAARTSTAGYQETQRLTQLTQ